MNLTLFSRVWSFFKFGSLVNPTTGEQFTGSGSTATDSGISVNDERAMQVSTVWACVEIITNSVASLPLEWYRVKGENKQPLEIDHPISRLMWGRPNKYMKTRDFRRALTMQMALWNNAYAKIDWDEGGVRPIAITPLNPARMRVTRDSAGLAYHYETENGPHVFADKSILHLKGITTEGTAALNRVDHARQTLGLSVSAQKYAAKQFANGGRPGGVLTVDKFLKNEQREQLRKIYEGISETADGANRLWVLEGGTDYKNINELPDKLQMIESQQHSAVELCRFWGVPSVLIGAGSNTSSAWPASFEQQVLAFLTFTLQSYIDEWEHGLRDALVPISERREIVVEHDENDFIRMDSTAKANYWSRLTQNGLATRNEGRKSLRLPKSDDPGADALTAQTNLTSLEDLPGVSSVSQSQ